MPKPVWDFIIKNRFFAMIIPKQYGGLEFSAYANAVVIQKLASRSATASSTVGVPNSLGPAELLLHYGTADQKNRYLPGLADGSEIPCFALTSPQAGSDAASLIDSGVVCKGTWNGKTIVGIRLNWDKRYITLAPVATVLGLAFKLYDPDHLIGDKNEYGITAALIPTDTKGVTVGRRHGRERDVSLVPVEPYSDNGFTVPRSFAHDARVDQSGRVGASLRRCECEAGNLGAVSETGKVAIFLIGCSIVQQQLGRPERIWNADRR